MQQKQIARKFVEHWTFRRGSEKGEDQQFWNSLLGDVLGMKDIASRIQYQVPVPMKGTTKFLDAWIPETKVLIEHKKRDVKLDQPQAGHGGMTPYEQAAEYDAARGFDEKARWIVTCNFDAIWIYDRSHPLDEPQKITVSELPKEVHRLSFLVKSDVQKVDSKELEISVLAGRIVGKLYDALLAQYNGSGTLPCVTDNGRSACPQTAAETLAALNRLCVRLVFCLYAEDADIFPKNAFRNLVKATPVEFLRRQLLRLFQTLDTPLDKRDRFLEAELAVFPYTNGGLFKGASESEIPPLTEEIAKLLDGSSDFDWSGISPTIFGALFESTLNPVTRRAGGMVYTSIENIHKVIDPLFLDDLEKRLDDILGVRSDGVRSGGVRSGGVRSDGVNSPTPSLTHSITPSLKKKLLALQAEIAALKFLDPACGSGNFLTETYLSLRRLENRIIAALQAGQGELDLGASVKVSISQFHGIEINDFAVTVAKTALWIAEAQMLKETAEILHREPDYLPLKEYDGIVQGNALRMEWGSLLNVANAQMLPIAKSNSQLGNREPGTENWKLGNGTGNTTTLATFSYIMGNPPFVGARNKSNDQAADMEAVFGKSWKCLGNLDYVTCWYKKAADYVLGTTEYTENREKKSSVYSVSSVVKNPFTKCAFVSTNSICQGEAVALLWKPLFESGIEIDFAWRTFRWDNEAQAKAHVHCVIIGFGVRGDNLTQSSQSPQSGRIETSRTSRTSREAKRIYDGDKVIEAANINGYLMDAPNAWIEGRKSPICDVPPLVFGSMPNDGGYLSDWGDEQKDAICSANPEAKSLFRRFLGASEFINNRTRWCLWLKNASPAIIRSIPQVKDAVANVYKMRSESSRIGTRKLAEVPTLFGEIRQPESGNYLLVPCHSSENRNYIPLGYISSDVICSNANLMIPSATLYHFGVLTSSVHMAWMRTVCGRLKSDYRYSANIVYNNFPWPEVENVANVQVLPITNTNSQLGNMERGTGDWKLENGTGNIGNTGNIRKRSTRSTRLNNSVCSVSSVVKNITQTAQSILDARSLYPDSSLVDLYDPLTMPVELRKAHAANDAAVMKAYGYAPTMTEPEIVADLMKRYQELVVSG